MNDEDLSAMFFINLLVDFCFIFDMLLNFVTIVEVRRWSCASRACHAACCASYVTWRGVRSALVTIISSEPSAHGLCPPSEGVYLFVCFRPD
jgi:hypothetical protein